MTPSRAALAETVARTVRAVAAAERPAAALAVALTACRTALGASGAALLRADAGRLMPVASDGLELAERPLTESAVALRHGGGYPLVLAGRVEGVLLLAGATRARLRAQERTIQPLLDLAAVALRNARLADEQTHALALATDSERRAREQYQSIPIPILTFQRVGQEFFLVDYNRATLAFSRGGIEALRGRSARELYADLPEVLSDIERCVAEQTTIHRERWYTLRTTGERKYLGATYVPVPPDLMMIHLEDLTAGHQAEEARSRLAAIVDASDDAIVGMTLDGTITAWNPGAERLYGYSAAEMVGRRLATIVPPERPDELAAIMERLRRGELVESYDTVRVHQDGRRLDVSVSISPLRDSTGLVIGAASIARDITARKEAERQLEALNQEYNMRALGQMASGVAHDLNQSLGLIAGHGDLAARALDETPPDLASLSDSIRIMGRAALGGAETVRRLLTFARPRQEGTPRSVDVGTLLNEVAQLTAPRWRDAAQAEGRPVDLRVEVQPDLLISGWPESLREALTNLVFNALDAMPEGGRLRLAAHRSGSQVIVAVADTGIGMSPEVQARVFEPFFTTKGVRGTGLGLAMVYRIVEQHEARIKLESTPGRGTTIQLAFPAASTSSAGAAEPAPLAVRPRRVLVVDDEPLLGQMLRLMLAQDGHTVVVAASGEEALEEVAAAPFDLVISDLSMGAGMNGWELAAAVRRRDPRPLFVLATGWGARITRDEARAQDVDAVIAKPYRLVDLRQTLAALDQ